MPKPEWSMQPDPKPTPEARPKQRAMRRKAVPPVSEKRRNDAKQYAAERLDYLIGVGFACELRVEGVCTGHASEIHHREGRGSHRFLDQSTWAAACHSCHVFATEHPAEAFELGLSERRNQSNG